ncbi:hypothetical protein APY04_1974 [Hyphomicrobium sulfonivorans]|uniref:Uncharacterized protein n=1 Tax=Hyphomicrobium sulfonivorans TaxID=121290 RepID=A0A125NUR0_HYPSL|nr:DUF975 family protein [Hyphomicrobium sulfonivorans]KWT67409.1 hypothetical protein APY04_1974 [Hyphomicrobium sulfonivorans]
MRKLSVGDCISFGWETFKKRPWFLIGTLLLVLIITSIPGSFSPDLPDIAPDGEFIPEPVSAISLIALLASIIVSTLAACGIVTFYLRAHDNVMGVQLTDFWNPSPFWRFLGAHILTGIAVTLGLMAFIVPGIIIGLGLMFVPYLVVERGLGPVEAIKESWRITKGNKWQLALLMLALLGIVILGLLALGVGVFVALPIAILASVHAYRTLTN